MRLLIISILFSTLIGSCTESQSYYEKCTTIEMTLDKENERKLHPVELFESKNFVSLNDSVEISKYDHEKWRVKKYLEEIESANPDRKLELKVWPAIIASNDYEVHMLSFKSSTNGQVEFSTALRSFKKNGDYIDQIPHFSGLSEDSDNSNDFIGTIDCDGNIEVIGLNDLHFYYSIDSVGNFIKNKTEKLNKKSH